MGQRGTDFPQPVEIASFVVRLASLPAAIDDANPLEGKSEIVFWFLELNEPRIEYRMSNTEYRNPK
jgi:hypothetical protein